MGKITNIIRRNKLYAVLAVFLLFINMLVLVDWIMVKTQTSQKVETSETQAVEESPAEEKEQKLFSDEDIARRQEKLEKLAGEDPLFYFFVGMFNLLILFVILIGILLDIYFVRRLIRKEGLKIDIISRDEALWTLADVVRVILIFLSFGYLFVILEGFFAGFFPILENENFRMIFNTAVMNVVGISVILHFIVKKHGQKIKEIGLSLKSPGKACFYGIVGYVSLIPILLVIMVGTFFVTKFLKYQPPVQPIVEVFIKEKETSVLLFSTLFAAICGPIAEEIFFRGFMYRAVKKKFGIFAGLIGTSAIFAFLHTHIVGFLPIMVLGLLLAYLYEKTGSLIPSITVHIIHNVGMVSMVFMMRGIGV